MDQDLMDRDAIAQAIRHRLEYAHRVGHARTPEQRLTDFVRLQKASYVVLCASPGGYRNFLRRNFLSRRVEVTDGKFRPVSPDRRAQQP